MTISLDLSKRHWQHTHGDITVIGTWLAIEGAKRQCMVLLRSGDEKSDHAQPCIVTIDQAWVWSEQVGDPRKSARLAFGFAQAMRLNEHNPKTIIRIATIIHDHLGDLLTIPPYTETDLAPVVADMTITNRDSGRVLEAEVRDDV